jgi:hypothetical protein
MPRRVDPAELAAEGPRAKLLVGAIVADRGAWAEAERELAAAFGPLEPRLLAMPFDHSDYYRGEMGGGLMRVFRVHREPVAQEELAAIKHRTIAIERLFADGEGAAARRRVNLDPGLLWLGGLVLATTKGYAHRVYLGRGVHAEPELVWRAGGYAPLPWTYADYRRRESLAFFGSERTQWLRELRAPAALEAPCG